MLKTHFRHTQRRPGRFDTEFLVLHAVAVGADYGYLTQKHIIELGGLRLPLRTIYRALSELATDGFLIGNLDGDISAPPDEWTRRIYNLTPAGRDRLILLRRIYRPFVGVNDGEECERDGT